MRDACTPNIAHAAANSMKRSRSATVSMEFCVTCGRPLASTKPRAFAVNSRSIGNVVPAMAPEPSGLQLACAATSASRARSRSSISIQANKWCERNTGWARWRWV